METFSMVIIQKFLNQLTKYFFFFFRCFKNRCHSSLSCRRLADSQIFDIVNILIQIFEVDYLQNIFFHNTVNQICHFIIIICK